MNVAKPVLQKTIPPFLLPPFLLEEKVYDTLAEVPVLREDVLSPSSSWTFARKTKSGEKMPQVIAHRGYKAEQPENTMGAFEGAVKVGAHALETDLHISKDDVVVLSHDATLKRCFGKDETISDCDWDYLSQQRTLRAPHQPMPRLQDLLEYLAKPGSEHIWLLLDIKITNDPEKIMRLIAHTISLVPPSPSNPWSKRLVLGVWAAKYLSLCTQYLPDYSITHIGFTISYARQFLALPNISFNSLQKSLMGPRGTSYIRNLKAKNRPLGQTAQWEYVLVTNTPGLQWLFVSFNRRM
ncbi:GPI biosynthesis protein [Physcia stellaris]|nr:GPI biosynthesis protein [Physcia stellaris]